MKTLWGNTIMRSDTDQVRKENDVNIMDANSFFSHLIEKYKTIFGEENEKWISIRKGVKNDNDYIIAAELIKNSPYPVSGIGIFIDENTDTIRVKATDNYGELITDNKFNDMVNVDVNFTKKEVIKLIDHINGNIAEDNRVVII